MAREASSHDWDVIVLGAGLYGIQAARTYLDIHPQARLVILELDSVVGGTWSSTRNYDAFWTQTPVGMAEFSDRPMTPPPREDQYYGYFPAKYFTQYLDSYVDNHLFGQKTLRERIVFNIRVKQVEPTERGWTVSFEGQSEKLSTSKLIDATGMTSQPNVPTLRGQEEFQGVAIHHKNFGQSSVLSDPKIQRIAVLGGAKSAADVAYAAAKAGKTVSWIIREKGSGPAALFPAQGSGSYANSTESLHTRLMEAFLPCPFDEVTMISRFLQGTRLGRWLVRNMWEGTDRGLRTKANFHRAEGKDKGFANLEPDTPVFWQNDSSGCVQRPDFFSTIARHVHVYRQEIDHLSSHAIFLALESGTDSKAPQTILVDAIIYCTGWTPISPLYTPSLALSLGLPVPLSDQTAADGESERRELENAKEQAVLSRFPILQKPPKYYHPPPQNTPFRLYKAIAPPSDASNHSIVFLGKLATGNNFRIAEVQALWAVAYLDGNIPHANPRQRRPGPSETRQREEDVANTIAWCRRRYLAKGEAGNWFWFDILSYSDMLLSQIGLRSHRGRSGWMRSLFSPSFARDLKGLVGEYKAKMQILD